MDCAKSGSRLEEVEMLTPQGEGVPLSLNWPVIKAMTVSLFRGTGILQGLGLLMKSNIIDVISSKPEWHPEYFEFSDEEQESIFKEYFDYLAPSIMLYINLKKRYGEYLADEITADMAIPIQLAWYSVASLPKGSTDIDQWRQKVADLFGNKAYECTQWRADDRTEYRMRWTKCAPIMILKAYGLDSWAANACIADHVVFDCLFPEVIFSRAHAIGAGDDFCDHTIRLPLGEDDRKVEEDYADCRKVAGGRERVRHWEEVYRRFGAFRF